MSSADAPPSNAASTVEDSNPSTVGAGKPRRAYSTTTPCRWGANCRYHATRSCRFVHPHPGGRFSVVHLNAGAVTEISSYLDKFTAIEKFNTLLPPSLSAEVAAKAVVFVLPSYYYVGVGDETWMLIGVHIHDMSSFVRLPVAEPSTSAPA
jgi:hypothetical protein